MVLAWSFSYSFTPSSTDGESQLLKVGKEERSLVLRLSKEPGGEDDVHIALEGVEPVNTVVAISPHECTMSTNPERRLR